MAVFVLQWCCIHVFRGIRTRLFSWCWHEFSLFWGSKNRKLYDINNICELSQRNFETFDISNVSFEQYKKGNTDTVTHFYEKLLKLENMMNTDYGKTIAKKRIKQAEEFIIETKRVLKIKN